MKLRVTVADDNPEFLDKLVSLLSSEFEVIATAASGKSVLECICRCRPDVAILDLEMPDLNGLEVVAKLKDNLPSPAFVICSTENDPDFVAVAFEAGVLGYVLKARLATDLIPAVKSAAIGRRFVSP